jgi:hypothetical protein
MQPQQAGNKNPKTFAHLLASVTSGTDIESHYYEFKDKNELAQSLTSHNVQTLASMIEARPAAISAIWASRCATPPSVTSSQRFCIRFPRQLA